MDKVSVTPLNIGHLRFDLTDIYNLPPDHPYAGQTAELPMICFHIALPGRSVMVDAAAYETEEISTDLKIPDYSPPPSLPDQLKTRGIDPEQVTDVIITHTHFDHFGALSEYEAGSYKPAFPRANHYLNRADWQPDDFEALEKRTLRLVEKAGLLNLIERTVELGDGLSILPMPGETPGHQILQVSTEEKNIYFAGDLYHHALEFADTTLNVYWALLPEMQTSKTALISRLGNSGGEVYFSHISGPYHVVCRDGDWAFAPE